MKLSNKLEWAYETLRDQLKFGLPEEQAIKQRERRARAVLKESIEEFKRMEDTIADLKRKSDYTFDRVTKARKDSIALSYGVEKYEKLLEKLHEKWPGAGVDKEILNIKAEIREQMR